MRMRIFWIAGTIVMVILSAQALLSAPPKTQAKTMIPIFTIQSDKMHMDAKHQEKKMQYIGNVILKAPLYTTLLTCNLLETNIVTSVIAHDDVHFTMVVPPTEKGASALQIDGHAQLMTLTLAQNNHIVILKTAHGEHPTLIVTDMGTNEPVNLSGETIEYNLDAQTFDVDKPITEHKESVQ